MTNKEIKQLQELEAKATNCYSLTSEEIILRNELLFKRNKQNIYVRLSGNNKYYYAFQCWDFTQHILTNGLRNYKASEIEGVSFHKDCVSIRFVSSAETDIKTFNNQNEMLNFVIGFNTCLIEATQ